MASVIPTKTPFRKQVKDVLEGAAGFAVLITVVGSIALYNDYEFPKVILGWSVFIMIAGFWIGSTIKPRMIHGRWVAGGNVKKPEW